MNELLVVNGLNVEIKKEISEQIKEFELQVKLIKEKEEGLKQKLLEEMRKNRVLKLDTPDLVITYVAPTSRESVDAKRFKEEKPDVYLEYVQISDVKDSIRIKVK